MVLFLIKSSSTYWKVNLIYFSRCFDLLVYIFIANYISIPDIFRGTFIFWYFFTKYFIMNEIRKFTKYRLNRQRVNKKNLWFQVKIQKNREHQYFFQHCLSRNKPLKFILFFRYSCWSSESGKKALGNKIHFFFVFLYWKYFEFWP